MKALKDLEKRVRFRTQLDREPSTEPQYFWISEKSEVLVVKIDGAVKIFNAICPHMGARLCLDAKRKSVYCPWHGLAYRTDSLKSDHFRYRLLTQLDGEVIDGELLIYG